MSPLQIRKSSFCYSQILSFGSPFSVSQFFCFVFFFFITRSYLFLTPWTVVQQASLSFTIFLTLIRVLSIESVMQPNHLIHCGPPSPSALNLYQHQGLFQWVSSSEEVTKYWNFSISPWFTGLISLKSKGLSRVFTITTVWKYQFFSAQSSL